MTAVDESAVRGQKRMTNRRHITAAILALTCLCLGLCAGCGVDLYADRRPKANANERWVSEDPEMYFTWSEEAGGFLGEITVHETTTAVRVCFDYGRGMDVIDPALKGFHSDMCLFQCDCKFGKDTLVAEVTRDDKNIFDGELPTFTFVREEVQGDAGTG